MTTFAYTALNDRRVKIAGTIEADSKRAAAESLRGQQLRPLSIQSQAESAQGFLNRELKLGNLSQSKKLSGKQRAFLFSQISLMTRSGMTLLQALETCSTRSTAGNVTRVSQKLSDDIQGGLSFSQALREQHQCFPNVEISLVESAEVTGELDQVLDRVVIQIEEKLEIKANLMTSLLYPAVVVFGAIGLFIFLAVKVIPTFATFFARRGNVLPPSTQLLLDISAFFQSYGTVMLVLITALVIALVYAFRNPSGRLLIDQKILAIPVIGTALTTAAMAQITRTLALLIGSGVSVLESFRIASGVTKNRYLSQILVQTSDRVLEGYDIAGGLARAVVPVMVSNLVAVGEKTGTLDAVFSELADYFTRELKLQIKRMSALIEPTMIVLVGGMVGFVYYAFIQALFQLSG